MTILYEHLHVDLSPLALTVIERLVRPMAESASLSEHTRQELLNLANECAARVQHAEIGEPDISEGQVDESS